MGGRGASGASSGKTYSGATLIGSDRQVSYARDLRQKASSAIDAGFKDAVSKMNPTPEQLKQAKSNINEAKKILNAETDAGAIINELGGISFRGSVESTFGDVMAALRRLQGRRR